MAATPFANHIHVRIARRLQNVSVHFRCNASRKAVKGNDIGAFGKNRNSVDDKFETLSPLIWLPPQFHGAQSGGQISSGNHFAADANRRREPITILRAIPDRIPAFWRFNAERKRDLVDARVELNSLRSVAAWPSG